MISSFGAESVMQVPLESECRGLGRKEFMGPTQWAQERITNVMRVTPPEYPANWRSGNELFELHAMCYIRFDGFGVVLAFRISLKIKWT
jgi:hypothetical protein